VCDASALECVMVEVVDLVVVLMCECVFVRVCVCVCVCLCLCARVCLGYEERLSEFGEVLS
jgi:hypothetical protein